MRDAAIAPKCRPRSRKRSGENRMTIGTRIDFGDSGEGRITARAEGRVFLESRDYTGWLVESWLLAQCRPQSED